MFPVDLPLMCLQVLDCLYKPLNRRLDLLPYHPICHPSKHLNILWMFCSLCLSRNITHTDHAVSSSFQTTVATLNVFCALLPIEFFYDYA